MLLKKELACFISKTLCLELSSIEPLLQKPKKREFGDIAFACFTLSKKLKKSPPLIALELEEILSKKQNTLGFLKKIKAIGPYLNFEYKTDHLAQKLNEQIKKGTFFESKTKKKLKILVEYSQPNTHKAFHVGHTRNISLGDSVCRLLKKKGAEVLAVNYIGDEGSHIAKFLWYYLKHFKGKIPKQHRGEFLGRLYVKASLLLDLSYFTSFPFLNIVSAKVLNIKPCKNRYIINLGTKKGIKTVIHNLKDLKENEMVAYAQVHAQVKGRRVGVMQKEGIKSEGMILSEQDAQRSDSYDKTFKLPFDMEVGVDLAQFFSHEKFKGQDILSLYEKNKKEVSEILQKLENKDTEITILWEKTTKWCMEEFREIYSWMDVHFDHYFCESKMSQLGKDLILKAYKKNLLKKDEGSIGIKFENLPFFILLKSDGNSLYSTKDIALAHSKFLKYPSDQYIYIVDQGQSLYFKQVFKTLEKLGYKDTNKCYHLDYGKVEGPDGKMSSRKGNTIYFSELKNQLMETIEREHLKKYKEEWTEDKIKETARKIAIATIKYGMLNQDNQKNIVFNMKEWLSLHGNTGPYLLYTYARIQSILRRSKPLIANLPILNRSSLCHKKEHFLLQDLSLYNEAFERSVEQLSPQLLCIYLFRLCKDFNQFYAECPILKPILEPIHRSRIELCSDTAKVLKEGLLLLGISVVEEM